MLATLAQHPGQTFSRAQWVDRLHNGLFQGFGRSIDALIKNLRRKPEPDASAPRYVLTVLGVRYRSAEMETW